MENDVTKKTKKKKRSTSLTFEGMVGSACFSVGIAAGISRVKRGVQGGCLAIDYDLQRKRAHAQRERSQEWGEMANSGAEFLSGRQTDNKIFVIYYN